MSPRDHILKAKELRLRDQELKLRGSELGQPYWEAKFKSKSDFTDNGIKGLILINGGAAVALGAFSKQSLQSQKLLLYYLSCSRDWA